MPTNIPCPLYIVPDDLYLGMSEAELEKMIQGLRECGLYHEPAPSFTVRASLDAFYHDIEKPPDFRPSNDDEKQFLEFEFTITEQGLKYVKRQLRAVRYNRPSEAARKALKAEAVQELLASAAQWAIKRGEPRMSNPEHWWEEDWLWGRWQVKTDEKDWPVVLYVHETLIALLATRNVERKSHTRHVTKQQVQTGNVCPYKKETTLFCPRPIYEDSEPAGGHHRSPRLHFRHGHSRSQHHGPANSLVKTVWIDAVMVMAADDDGDHPSPVFRLTKG